MAPLTNLPANSPTLWQRCYKVGAHVETLASYVVTLLICRHLTMLYHIILHEHCHNIVTIMCHHSGKVVMLVPNIESDQATTLWQHCHKIVPIFESKLKFD